MHKLAHDATLIQHGDPLFETKALSYRYPHGPLVLDNISLSVYQGDRLALIGANGSGKSTLVKHLGGLLGHNAGNVNYKGCPLSGSHLGNARFEIGVLFQDPDDHLFCNTLYDDVAFGPLNQGRSQDETKGLVNKALTQVALLEQQNRAAHQLSYGQKKRAALAAILAMQPETLILDEPTVNLDPSQVAIITELLQQFRGTIICISHDLLFLKEICNRAIVLKNGTINHAHSIDELWTAPTAIREHGLDYSFRYSCCNSAHHNEHQRSHGSDGGIFSDPPPNLKNENHPIAHHAPLLQLNSFSYHHPDGTLALDNINLVMERGERLALIGENGAGKSTLACCLAGIYFGSGSYLFNSQQFTKKNRKKLWQKVGVIFQDSADQLFCPNCYEEVAFGLRQRKLAKNEIRKKVEDALAMVHLEGFEERSPLDLSGGERKRLAIASVICLQPKVLIMDEPTAGLDPQGEEMFLAIINELKMAQILISHDLLLVAKHCSRVLIINNGSVSYNGSTDLMLSDGNDNSNLTPWGIKVCKLNSNSPPHCKA